MIRELRSHMLCDVAKKLNNSFKKQGKKDYMSWHAHTQTHTDTQTHTHRYTHTETHRQTHTQTHTLTHTYTHTRTRTCGGRAWFLPAPEK